MQNIKLKENGTACLFKESVQASLKSWFGGGWAWRSSSEVCVSVRKDLTSRSQGFWHPGPRHFMVPSPEIFMSLESVKYIQILKFKYLTIIIFSWVICSSGLPLAISTLSRIFNHEPVQPVQSWTGWSNRFNHKPVQPVQSWTGWSNRFNQQLYHVNRWTFIQQIWTKWSNCLKIMSSTLNQLLVHQISQYNYWIINHCHCSTIDKMFWVCADPSLHVPVLQPFSHSQHCRLHHDEIHFIHHVISRRVYDQVFKGLEGPGSSPETADLTTMYPCSLTPSTQAVWIGTNWLSNRLGVRYVCLDAT